MRRAHFLVELETILKKKDKNYFIEEVDFDKNGMILFIVEYIQNGDKFYKPLKIAIHSTNNPEEVSKVVIDFFNDKNNFIMN